MVAHAHGGAGVFDVLKVQAVVKEAADGLVCKVFFCKVFACAIPTDEGEGKEAKQ